MQPDERLQFVWVRWDCKWDRDERSSEKTAQMSDKRSSGLYEMVGETKRESGEKKAQTSDKHLSELIEDVREAEVMGFNERNSPDECL